MAISGDTHRTDLGRGSLVPLAIGLVLIAGCAGLAFVIPPRLAQALLQGWLAHAAGPWALPTVVLAFAALAFLGVPQVVLIAAAVAALGPGWGAFDSWAGTLVSALVGFWLGRRLGAGVLRRASGPRAAALLQAAGRNGLAASLIVRLLPSVPFLAVNMTAGALPIGTADYALGTAVGIIPKIALVALAGGSLLQAPLARPHALAGLAIAGVVWLALSLAAWLWLRRRARS